MKDPVTGQEIKTHLWEHRWLIINGKREEFLCSSDDGKVMKVCHPLVHGYDRLNEREIPRKEWEAAPLLTRDELEEREGY